MEVGVVAVSRVGQHDRSIDPGRAGGTQLVKRDLRLGLGGDIIGHARLRAPVEIIDPLMQQIQAIGDRQAGVIVGGRAAPRLADQQSVAPPACSSARAARDQHDRAFHWLAAAADLHFEWPV